MPFVVETVGAPPEIMAAAGRELLNSISSTRPGRGCGARRAAVPSAVRSMPSPALEPFGRRVTGGGGTGGCAAALGAAPPIALVTSGCAHRRGQHGPAQASKHGAK
jgi:hypothetical protein